MDKVDKGQKEYSNIYTHILTRKTMEIAAISMQKYTFLMNFMVKNETFTHKRVQNLTKRLLL